MKEENIINNYLYNDFEKSYQNNMKKIEIISMIQDRLLKIDFYLSNFSTEDFEISILQKKLSLFNGEEKFVDLFLSIYKTIETILYDYSKMINKLLKLVNQIKQAFNPYLNEYNEFLNAEKKFFNYLKNIENAKKDFFETSKNAELYTYEFVKKKINNINVNKQNEFKYKEDLKNLAKFQLEKYGEEIAKGNVELKSFNDIQKELFKAEKQLEIEYNDCYSNCLMSYYEHHLIILGFINSLNEKLVKMTESSEEKKLEDYLKDYRQKDQIDFEQYKTNIEFDKCKNVTELSACFMAYNELANYIGKYKEIEKLNENKILEVCIETDRILNSNNKITDKDYEKIIEFLKDDLGKNVFFCLFDLIMTSGKNEKSEKFINIIGKVLKALLESAEKDNNYELAKNCIVISETFYFLDSEKEKKYAFTFIKDYKWLKGSRFWRGFINFIFKKEFEKLNDLEKKKHKNASIIKILSFYINIMKRYEIDIRIIIKIFDEVSEKYKYLNEESYFTIFSVLSNDITIIEEYRKEYKKNPDLEKQLYNYEYEDEDDKEKKEDNNNNQFIDK